MYAIIESGGKQFKVERNRRVRVPSLAGGVGDEVTFDRVLYASDENNVRVGSPLVEGVKVVGEIVSHGRGPKVIVFKFKKRHRFRKKQGHRQGFTEVAITGLELGQEDAEERRDSVRQRKPQRDAEKREVVDTGGAPGGEEAERAEAGGEEAGGEGAASGGTRQVGPYICEGCGRGFATERGLQQHRAKAHVE